MPPRGFLRRLPKIDLHMHLEGSLPRATLAALAAKHRLPVPRPRSFHGFGDFLRAFGMVCDLLVDEADFERAASDLLARSRRLGIVHAEILFSPQVFLRRGIPLAAMMRGLLRARRRALAMPGLSAVYILDGVRQWGGEWFEEVVAAAAPWAGRGLAGVGVGGDETALPARAFARAFRRARALGLRATIHAGEAAGPESVREALESLQVRRIGHGVRAVEDPSLLADLARRRVTLEVCPGSNVATGVFASIRDHPARKLLEAGVPITINSDDGSMFGTDVAKEIETAARIWSFSREEILRVTLNAARAAFLPERRRRRLERAILQRAAAAGQGG